VRGRRGVSRPRPDENRLKRKDRIVKKIDRTMADDLVEKAVIRFIATFQDFTDKDGFFNIKPDLTVDLYKIGYALLDQFGEIIEGE
jgi:hypothetical protein